MNRHNAHPLVLIAFAGGVVACGTSSNGASNGLSSSPTADAPSSASTAPDASAVTPQPPTPSIPSGSATASASSGPGVGGGGQGPTGDGGAMAAGGAQPAAGGETASPGGAGSGGEAGGTGGGEGEGGAPGAGRAGAAGASGGAPVDEVFDASFLEVAALIDARCGSQCHSGREGQEHLANFSTEDLGAFYDRVTAPLMTDLCYGESPVTPGEPESSLLVQVISGPSETPCVLPRMPAGCEQDESCLDADDIALVEAWIAAGAPRN